MSVTLRLGLEIERENVETECPECDSDGETSHDCDCDYCGRSYEPCWSCGGSNVGDGGGAEAPIGWTSCHDGSLENGVEYKTDRPMYWRQGQPMPVLWSRAREVQDIGEAAETAGIHVHVSCPDIDPETYRTFGAQVLLETRRYIWRAVDAADPDRCESQYCMDATEDGYEDSIPSRYDGYYDIVWRECYGSFELRLFSSYMSYQEVWGTLQPVLDVIAEEMTKLAMRFPMTVR